MTTPTNENGNLIDEFEEVFHETLNLFLTENNFNHNGSVYTMSKDETKASVDQVTQRFLDSARQVESYFLQERFLKSAFKPELIVKEETLEMKMESLRKDEIIKKNTEKILMWQNALVEINRWLQSNGPVNVGHGNQNFGAVNGNPATVQQQFLQRQQMQQLTQQPQHTRRRPEEVAENGIKHLVNFINDKRR